MSTLTSHTATTALFEDFVERANDPSAQFEKYLSEGKKVVLTAPEYTPGELIHAMGIIPMGVWGANLTLDRAKSYFPTFICSVLQSTVELGMRGDFEGASALVVPYLCDSLKVMGENWKYAVPSIPFIPLPYPQNRTSEAGIAFVTASYKRIIHDLTEITGASFSDEALKKSIVLYNEHNAVMREFAAVAAQDETIEPASRSAVFKSAFFMEVSEHTALVRQLIDALKATRTEQADTKSPLRIITSGIIADHPALLALLDDNGFVVVGDDVAAESRQYLTDAPPKASGLESLAYKFAAMGNCSLLYDPEKSRIQHIISMAQQESAHGVVIIQTVFCDPEEFDAPFIENACRDAGIPSIKINVDRQMTDLGQGGTSLLAFKELLTSRL